MRRLALLLALPLMVVTAALPPSADAQQPRRGGVFRIAEREAPSLDPHLSISFLTHSYVSLVYSQLVRFPNGPEQKSPTDFSIVPDLAEKWTISKDGKIYTFHLRRGVRFHNKPPVNAREVTAEDVKYSLERFPDYFMKGFPYLDGVVIEITPDAAARVAVLRAGKADLPHIWGWVSPEEGKALQKTNPELVVVPHQVIGQGFIYMRTDQPPFNDIRVRRAVSLAIDRNAWNDALLFGEGCIDPGPIPCALKEWKLAASKLDAAKAKYLVGHDPAEAKKLLAEAGHGKGLTVPLFHWPGYVVPWRSYYELAADNLGKVGITVELKPEEYGKYISTTALGKYEKMAMGPSTPFTEVDDFLYGRFYPELPTNQSRVADAELSKMLTAQRREMDPKKRKQVVDDIQRYLADKAYYVYVPQWPQYVAHPAYVKGFRHHDGYGLGMRLIHTWLDK